MPKTKSISHRGSFRTNFYGENPLQQKTRDDVVEYKRHLFRNIVSTLIPITKDTRGRVITDERKTVIDNFNNNIDMLLNPDFHVRHKGVRAKQIGLITEDRVYEALYQLHNEVSELIIERSPHTTIDFFAGKIRHEINPNDKLILFLNAHGARLNDRDVNMLGRRPDMNYCETSLSCHSKPRFSSTSSTSRQNSVYSGIVGCIGDSGDSGRFCSQYIDEIGKKREEIFAAMDENVKVMEDYEKGIRAKFERRRTNTKINEEGKSIENDEVGTPEEGKEGKGMEINEEEDEEDMTPQEVEKFIKERREFFNQVKSRCVNYVTTRCNDCVSNKRYSYDTKEGPGRFNLNVLLDSSRNISVGTSLLIYPPDNVTITFTTQDILNQAYAVGYRNVGIISGACLNYTVASTEEDTKTAVEISRVKPSGRSIISASKIKRGGVTKRIRRVKSTRKRNKSLKRKRHYKHKRI
jgi:hypothetical protein